MDDASRRRQEDWEKSLAAWKSKHGKDKTGVSSVLINNTPSNREHGKKDSNFFTKFLIFLAFAIPIAILGYVLYVNYLPFGYEKTYTLTIDEDGIISPLSNEIYLTNSQGRKILSLPEGVQGQVNLVLEPNVVLKDAILDVSIEGDGVYLPTPLNISDIDWNYDWSFIEGIPEGFGGTAEYRDDEMCIYFNAYNEETLYLLNSKDMFESNPMSIYVKWKPSLISKLLGNNQQIMGHFNWEIWQNEDSVRFQVGRVNNANGSFYSINYPIDKDFFNKEHEALAIYKPDSDENGYIELWIDNKLAERVFIGSDEIYRDYNSERDLSLGWSAHNYAKNPYFDGCVYDVKITNEVLKQENTHLGLNNVNSKIIVPIIGNGKIESVKLTVRK